MLQIWPDNKPLKDEKNIWKEHKIKKRSILFDKIEVENVIFAKIFFGAISSDYQIFYLE